MKTRMLAAFLLSGMLVLTQSQLSLAGEEKIHPYLRQVMATLGPSERIGVNIQLSDCLTIDYLLGRTLGMDKHERRATVVQALQQHAEFTQTRVRSYLATAVFEDKASDPAIIWMINVIHVQATSEVIADLAGFGEVKSMYYDAEHWAEELEDVAGHSGSPPDVLPPNNPGLTLIRAQQAWALGYRGQGIIVGNIDTGVDYTHPDLRNHYYINPGEDLNHNGQFDLSDINGIDDDSNGFIDDIRGWDFGAGDNDATYQTEPHGVSTTGIVVGDGTNGDTTGVAPQAKILALKAYSATGSSTESSVWQCMQYAVMMGADITTSSLSWKWAFTPKPQYHMWRAMSDMEYAAGVLHTNSIGNQGGSSSYPIPYNIATPGNSPTPWFHKDQIIIGRPSSTLGCGDVGATTDVIQSSSGRGPAAWEDIQVAHPEYPYVQPEIYRDYPWETITPRGRGLIKPDVCAPGANTRSTAPGGGYSSFSGTSGATPHVAGTAALVFSANPHLMATDVAQILMTTGVEKGAPGKDSLYGAGRIDARNAVFASRHPVAGIIRDSATNAPVGYAKIYVPELNYTFSTNAMGEYIIFAKIDTITLNVTASGHTPRSTNLVVPEAITPLSINFTLSPLTTLSVSGSVKSSADSSAVRAEIRAYVDSSSTTNPVGVTTANASGSYSLNLFPGRYRLIIEPEAPYLTKTITGLDLTQPSTTLNYFVGVADVLLVDDDAGDGQQMFYKLALDANSKTYYTWETFVRGTAPIAAMEKLRAPKIVFWSTGNADTTALTSAEFQVIGQFVASSERRGLLLSGQNIAQFADTAQLRSVIGVRYGGTSTETVVRGVAGDSISNGMLMNTTGGNGSGNQTSRDILVVDGNAIPFLQYGASSPNVAGVRRILGDARLAFLGFGLESVPDNQGTTSRTAFVNKVLQWFAADMPTGVVGDAHVRLPEAFRLEQNYPNPFNPSTTIKFRLSRSETVLLEVFDITGRRVATLVNDRVSEGEHTVVFDAKNLSSGTYGYTLNVAGHVLSQKMTLVK